MKLREMPADWWTYTQLARTALAVVVRRSHGGYSVYVGGVPGIDHDAEARDVRAHGDKQRQPMAKAICENLFHPPIDPEGLSCC